jgi:Skp family chaperone for outer membrane proteins
MTRTWWMGLLAVGVAGAVGLMAVSGLYAGNRAGFSTGRVACLDVAKIFAEYQRQKDLTEEMRAIEQEMQAEFEQRRDRGDSLQATLDAMSQNDPMFAKRWREMLRMQFENKNWSDLMQADTAREVGLWTRRIYGEILEVTEETAQREGYDMVLYRSAGELVGYDPEAIRGQIRARTVLYADPAADITQAVLDTLNERYRAQPKTQMLQISPTLGP